MSDHRLNECILCYWLFEKNKYRDKKVKKQGQKIMFINKVMCIYTASIWYVIEVTIYKYGIGTRNTFRLERTAGIAFVYNFLILHLPFGSTINKT
jgi:hypothetical protein